HVSASHVTSIGDTMSPRIRIRPFMMPNADLRRARTGDSRATGWPRFVTTIDAPVAATVSISSRHFALNSAAEIVSGSALERIVLMTMNMTIARAAATAAR